MTTAMTEAQARPTPEPEQIAAFLAAAGRLLLLYNESTRDIDRSLRSVAGALGSADCLVSITYRYVSVAWGSARATSAPVAELHYNMAILGQVHELLRQVKRGTLSIAAAQGQLEHVEAHHPGHTDAVGVVTLGLAAGALAALLGADVGAVAIASLAAGIGLAARRRLGRWHFSLLTLPLAAAFIGALLGGIAIRMGWTTTPKLALVVPALMLVPGPHLINGLLDLIDNYLPMALARLSLAAAILAASALGLVLGIELTLIDPIPPDVLRTERINLPLDMTLAAMAACGFAVFYNTGWRQLWIAAVLGMVGHGLRFLALAAGCRLEAATFLGALVIGSGAAWLGRRFGAPVAVLAFAGAVTMMPGLAMYSALGGAMKLSQQGCLADVQTAAIALADGVHAGLVVTGLVLGLVIGVRLVEAVDPMR
ncbi:MAG TPA: threonine/serine exporter family protein, partial [Gemmatales bacterium]|nr:threonine/serine exporter family protein [Gemmatales bacterium]